MNRKYLLVASMLLVSWLLVACGGGETVEVTRVVEVEVTRVVEVAGEGGEAAAAPAEGGGDTLSTVLDRGTLRCGGNQSVPGFGYINPDTNNFEGFDIDFCKVVAAAVLADAEAVEVRPTTANERFPVLQSGEVDLLIRNTTWTISRDPATGVKRET